MSARGPGESGQSRSTGSDKPALQPGLTQQPTTTAGSGAGVGSCLAISRTIDATFAGRTPNARAIALGERPWTRRDRTCCASSYFFDGFGAAPLEAPVDLARHLVWGGVAYARRLGFEPHPDFGPAAEHLAPLEGPSAIGFGRYGKPFYTQGPFDDADRILRTLRERVGGECNFIVAAGPEELAPMP